jgi:anti-anti-sigma regulatory factor
MAQGSPQQRSPEVMFLASTPTPVIAATQVLPAPQRLVADTRVDFRCQALECIDRLSESGGDALTIDMHETKELDASGLGILVLVHKRARERGLPTRLVRTPQPVRTLLSLTKLDTLFEFES